MTPPIVAASVLRRPILGVVARLAALPLAWVGATLLLPYAATALAGTLATGALVASTMAASSRPAVARAGLALAAVVVAIPAHAAVPEAIVGGPLAGLAFAHALRETRLRAGAPLDADARALAPVAVWLAGASVVVRIGAERGHLHVVVPQAALAGAALGLALAVLGAIAFARHHAWIAAVYRGGIPGLRVGPPPHADDPAPRLADAGPCDAALVLSSDASGPYRAGAERIVVARVPERAAPLLTRARHALLAAAAAAAAALLALSAQAGPLPARAHREDPPAALPPLPAACATARPTLRFVALEPLRSVDARAIAARYRESGVAAVAGVATLPLDPALEDPGRKQLMAEKVASAVRRAHPPREGELVVALTDRDMYMLGAEWRYAFAYRTAGIAVVSVARMDPEFPWVEGGAYVPEPAPCTARLRARAFKMITRQVLFAACAAPAEVDPTSARRASVLSLEDLDAIDEARY